MLREQAQIIQSAISDLFANQPNILSHTDETTMTEWNLAHHLSNEISKYLFWLDNDNDVTKKIHGFRRPDMIFHRRGRSNNNWLVVELKIANSINDDDTAKITQDWLRGGLKYSFGACVSIANKDKYCIQIVSQHQGCDSITQSNPIIFEYSKGVRDSVIGIAIRQKQAEISEQEVFELINMYKRF